MGAGNSQPRYRNFRPLCLSRYFGGLPAANVCGPNRGYGSRKYGASLVRLGAPGFPHEFKSGYVISSRDLVGVPPHTLVADNDCSIFPFSSAGEAARKWRQK